VPESVFGGDLVAQWVGETLLGTSKPVVISELPFLMVRFRLRKEADQDAVGKIDEVCGILKPAACVWCALENSAV